jgi:SAM-dependent methyltransferase
MPEEEMKRRNIATRVAVFLMIAGILAGLSLSSGGDAFSFTGIDSRLITPYDAPYVPTGSMTIDEMLRICRVTKDDIVYDLGSGDGRIVIAAAKNFGARGVGIEIDPGLIEQSRQNAVKAGVEERVRFIEQDLFKADFGEATVVTLYLLPEMNLKLRPLLIRQLNPGSRVVAHDFPIAGWQPDRVERSFLSTIYFWVVPANASGEWEWQEARSPGQLRRLKLGQLFQQVRGSLRTPSSVLPLSDALIKGDYISFTVNEADGSAVTTAKYEGRIRGNTIEGTVQRAGRSGTLRSYWSAKRDPLTKSSIEPAG